MIVGEFLTSVGVDCFGGSFDFCDITFSMINAVWEDRFHVTISQLRLTKIGSKHRPTGLVVMFFRGIEDSNVIWIDFGS